MSSSSMMPSSCDAENVRVFGPTEDDSQFFGFYAEFLSDVTNGQSTPTLFGLFHSLAFKLIVNRSILQRSTIQNQLSSLLIYLNHPSSTLYRRVVCRVSITFMCRFYSDEINQYTHTELAKLSQEGLDMLAAAKLQCGTDYYDVHFPRVELLGREMRDWHTNEVFRGVPGWIWRTWESGVEDLEVVEAVELLRRSRI